MKKDGNFSLENLYLVIDLINEMQSETIPPGYEKYVSMLILNRQTGKHVPNLQRISLSKDFKISSKNAKKQDFSNLFVPFEGTRLLHLV